MRGWWGNRGWAGTDKPRRHGAPDQLRRGLTEAALAATKRCVASLIPLIWDLMELMCSSQFPSHVALRRVGDSPRPIEGENSSRDSRTGNIACTSVGRWEVGTESALLTLKVLRD